MASVPSRDPDFTSSFSYYYQGLSYTVYYWAFWYDDSTKTLTFGATKGYMPDSAINTWDTMKVTVTVPGKTAVSKTFNAPSAFDTDTSLISRGYYYIGEIPISPNAWTNTLSITLKGFYYVNDSLTGNIFATPDEWTIYKDSSATNLIDDQTLAPDFVKYAVNRIRLSFKISGRARVYTNNDTAAIGYVTASSVGISSITGAPSEGIINQDGGAMGIDLEWDVEAGKSYYLYVHFIEPNTTATLNLSLAPPRWVITSTDYIYNITDEVTRQIFMYHGSVDKMTLSFKDSGIVKIYTTGDMDTVGVMAAYDQGVEKDTGDPAVYLVKDDDGGSGENYQLSFMVKAEQLYYVYTRFSDGRTNGSTTIIIKPPVKGGVHITTGSENRSFLVWIYSNGSWGKYMPLVYSTIDGVSKYHKCG